MDGVGWLGVGVEQKEGVPMSRVNVLDFARLSAQVLRLPRRAREDLSKLLAESLAEGQPKPRRIVTKYPVGQKAEKKEGAE